MEFLEVMEVFCLEDGCRKFLHNDSVYKTIWRHFKTYLNLNTHHLENLKFQIYIRLTGLSHNIVFLSHNNKVGLNYYFQPLC